MRDAWPSFDLCHVVYAETIRALNQLTLEQRDSVMERLTREWHRSRTINGPFLCAADVTESSTPSETN